MPFRGLYLSRHIRLPVASHIAYAQFDFFVGCVEENFVLGPPVGERVAVGVAVRSGPSVDSACGECVQKGALALRGAPNLAVCVVCEICVV